MVERFCDICQKSIHKDYRFEWLDSEMQYYKLIRKSGSFEYDTDICSECLHKVVAFVRGEIDELIEPIIESRLKGKWIDDREYGNVECPFCHEATNCDDNIEELHYCWNCGAELTSDMER